MLKRDFLKHATSLILVILFVSCAANYNVAQNEPNPFNAVTMISFSLPKAGNTTVEIHNLTGQKVDTLLKGYCKAGRYSIGWDGSNFSSGVYFYVVKSGEFNRTMKMTLIK